MASRGHQRLVTGLPPFVWLEGTQPGSLLQASALTSPNQMAALPSLLSIPVAPIRLNGHLSPPHSEREDSQAWCFKPLLKEGLGFMYKRVGRWYMYKNDWAPAFPSRT